ncbi:hypothetical protein JJJ17_09405 [Paracoccus caeni]|uniref:Uncharacterized protein n=1 Tax=Paracoccus caeni TaxID=657651 RepID=A0A934SC64_9RHOB|nr:hypothetical protein [Paracoccus caeni]MBK4216141.1 hypothetical protein [Paracoccus caeni]
MNSYEGLWLDLHRKMEILEIKPLNGSQLQVDYVRIEYRNFASAQPTRGSIVGELIGGRLLLERDTGTFVMFLSPEKGVLGSYGAGTYLPVAYEGDYTKLLDIRASGKFREMLQGLGIEPE